MTNPFEALNVSDDEEPGFTKSQAQQQKPKRTHQERKQQKLQKQQGQESAPSPAADPLPERFREDAKARRNPRQPPTPLTKKLGEGHFHDRRSGTGRT